MAEDKQSTQGGSNGNADQTIQQVQQGTIQQKQQDPEVLRKSYGPLVEPAPDAFPIRYRSPYVPGPGATSAAAAPEPTAAPAVDPGAAGTSSTTTNTQQQQGENS